MGGEKKNLIEVKAFYRAETHRPRQRGRIVDSRSPKQSFRLYSNRLLAPDFEGRATRIRLFNFSTPPMRTFHLSWIAFS
jgi:hypothetical protein